jgi:tetratricopeptide (TPR) repeat protein/predicted Ser/Thr protein kinase
MNDPGTDDRPTETVRFPLLPNPESAAGPLGQLERGAAVGRYLILDRVGGGGMGVVYAGYDPELDRKVALKLLRPDRSEESSRLRLLREAQAIARLSHPNVIAVHDAGTFGDDVFLAMELVPGTTLGRWLEGEPRPWREVVERFLAAGRGLAAAHAAGLVHRDFKPDNVLLGEDGRVLVADFGLARPAGAEEERTGESPAAGDIGDIGGIGGILASPLTEWGVVLGTPAYMAPEQLRGEAADARSDQFSFCVALWEALYGERPFAGGSARVPGWLRQVLACGLAEDPALRHPSMEALLGHLESGLGAGRRRWLAAAGAVLALGAAFSGLGYFQARQAQLCGGAEEKLSGIWGAERKAAVRAAFLATRAPFAGVAWARVEQALDSYGRSWAEMRRSACAATRLRGEQSEDLLDRRMFCLDQRLRDLDALADLFSRADRQIVENAVKASSRLTPLDGCADLPSLTARVPLPAGSEQRARVEAVGRETARVRALRAAGRYREALAQAAILAREAARLKYPPLLAEALYLRGDLEERTGDLERAERTLRQAVWKAEAARDDKVKAEAAIAYLYLVGKGQHRFDVAHPWEEFTAAILDRLDERDALRAEFVNMVGFLREAEGRYEESLARHLEAAAIRRRALGPQAPEVAAAVANAGVALFRLGKYREAGVRFGEALKIQEAALGPAHPEVADSINRLANVSYVQGRYEEALELHRRALKIRTAALGPRHRLSGDSHQNLGNCLDLMGRPEEALEHYRSTLAIYRQALGPDHPEVSNPLNSLGAVFAKLERWDEARSHLQQALDMRLDSLGPDHPSTGITLYNFGELLKKQGRYPEAVPYYERALAIDEAALGPDHPNVADGLTILGDLERRLGKPEKALGRLRRALAIVEKQEADLAAAAVATTRFALARALWEARGDEQAFALARRAREGFLADRALRAEVEEWLSRHGEAKPRA